MVVSSLLLVLYDQGWIFLKSRLGGEIWNNYGMVTGKFCLRPLELACQLCTLRHNG